MTDDDLETCPFCGFKVETPCDEPPAVYCETALDLMYPPKS